MNFIQKTVIVFLSTKEKIIDNQLKKKTTFNIKKKLCKIKIENLYLF